MTTLARWRAAHCNEGPKKEERRPYLASECKNLRKCEKWRNQIIREIAKKVAQIQNAGLFIFLSKPMASSEEYIDLILQNSYSIRLSSYTRENIFHNHLFIKYF